MKQFKKLMVFMLAALMVFGTIKYTPIYAEDAVAKEEGVFDTVTFEGKKDITIHAGKPFTFTQKIKKENEINTGEEEIIPETENASQEKKKPIVTVKPTREGDSAKYRAIVSEVKTPEGGNFVYHEGDTTFMPAEADIDKEYVITYQAETSIDDGKTWQAVPDAKYEVHVKIAEKEEQTTESEEQLTSEESEDEHNQENLQITADDIVFHGENEKTISIGTNYNFYDMNNIYASGPSDHHELYAITVEEVETPEGGSYVYQNGDQQFTPTKDDSNLDYTITYGVSVSTDDGTTWHKVDNAEFVTKLHIDKAENTRSARRRRSVPIYAGMISHITFGLEDTYYTGQAVNTTVSVAINGTSTVDEPFIFEIVVPKDGIYGTNPTESRYRLQISDYSKALETHLTEDTNNYIMSYKLMPGSQAQVFAIPLNFKFLRTGDVPAGTQYTITAKVKDLNGNTVKTESKTTTLEYNKPNNISLSYSSYSTGFTRGSQSLNEDNTKLTNDQSKLPFIEFYPYIQQPIQRVDSQNDSIGIRKISQIVDTYTLPEGVYVDTTRLSPGMTYNAATRTITRIITNTNDWGEGGSRYYKNAKAEDLVPIKIPGATIGQLYPVTITRQYKFDTDPSSNFSLTTTTNIRFSVYQYTYEYYLDVMRKQTGYFDITPTPGGTRTAITFNNIIDWQSNPYTEFSVIRMLGTNDPNPVSKLTPTSASGLTIANDELDSDLKYKDVVINPGSDSRPTTFNGTLNVVGTKFDGTEVIIASNLSYPVGSSLSIPISDDIKTVKVVANSGSTFETIKRNYYKENSPDTYAKQGIQIRYTYQFKDGLDSNEPHIFKGKVNLTKPTGSNDQWEFFDYGRYYTDRVWGGRNLGLYYGGGIPGQTDYPYAFYYCPTSDIPNRIDSVSPQVTTISGTGNKDASFTGDVFNYKVSYIKVQNARNTQMQDGKFKITLPIGYDLVEGSEVFVLGTNGTFEKNPTSILNSRTGPFLDTTTNRKYYLYDVGDVNVPNVSDTIFTLSFNLKHTSYNPTYSETDYSRYIETRLEFGPEQHVTVYETNTRNTGALHTGFESLHLYPPGADEYNRYIIAADKRLSTSIPVAGNPYNYGNNIYRFNDAKNYLYIGSKRITAYTGADYINDVIDIAVQISSNSILNNTYATGNLDLNLPDGLEIVPGSETLTDYNGNFHSDKSLSEIVASRQGGVYDFGKVTMTANNPWNLMLNLKVKVTDRMISGETYFNPTMKIISPSGSINAEETIDKNNKRSGYRQFRYVPTTGLYGVMTGMNVTRKSYVRNGGFIDYEINVGNYTGNTIKNTSIISYFPGVGDIDSAGNPRNSELTPIVDSVYVDSSKYTLYVSKDSPIPGMTVAEYDGIATWTYVSGSANSRDLKDVKAIKVVAIGDITHGYQSKAATISCHLDKKDLTRENNGKIINNSFAVRYKVGTLDTNYVESNVKQYEYKALKVNGRIFLDVNNNGVYDENDTIIYSSLYGSIVKDGITEDWEINPYDNTVPYSQSHPFRTLLFPEEGSYVFKVKVPQGMTLLPYGAGENQSNIHPDTGFSEPYNLRFDGTDEAFLNIGFQTASSYTVKYDLNGGHIRNSTATTIYRRYAVGQNMNIEYGDDNSYLKPYHTMTRIWNTEPDGTGTSYTMSQLVNGGLSSTPNAEITLYLQWTPINNYTVRYNPNGPTSIISGSMADDNVTVGTGYTVRNNGFTNTHATFAGWVTEDGTPYYEGQYVGDLWDGDITRQGLSSSRPVVINLYANWKQELYTFKSGEANIGWGSGTIENPDHPRTDPYGGHPNNYAALNPVVGARFRINKINADGSEGELVSSATSKAQGQLYFPDVSVGKYYLTEEYTPDGYIAPKGKWIINVKIDQFTGDLVIETGYAPDPDAKTDPSMPDLAQYPYYMKSMNGCIVNEGKYYRNVSLSTRISDENLEFASIHQNYRYKLTFLDKNFNLIKNTTYNIVGDTIPGVTNPNPAPSNGTITTDDNGVAYITLKHGQRIEIKDVLGTSKISVLQLTEGGDIYTQIDNSGFAFNPDRAVAVKVLGKNGHDIAIDYKIMNFSPVPTGIHHMNNKSILLGVGVIVFLMLVAYSVYVRKRRYHRMNISEDRDIYASRMVPKGVKVDAYQEDQTEIKPPVGGPSPGIRNPHHRSRDSTDLQLPIWMVSDTG